MKNILLFFSAILFYLNIYSQTSSRNGYWLHNTDTIRMLIVFAEVNDYASDVSPDANWPAGELPLNANNWIDADFTGVANIVGELTNYYYQASLGNFIVLGDYVDSLFSIDSASLIGYFDGQIVSFINSLGGMDLSTAKGKSINNKQIHFQVFG